MRILFISQYYPPETGAAASIDRLVNEPELAMQMGENGKRAVQGKYNWEKESEKLLKLYEELCRK
jgi:glycosyltransferase involved in cell wall biosynthesis